MASEWDRVRIGDLGRVVTGKTPSTTHAANFGGRFPFITIPDLGRDRYVVATARTLSEDGASVIRSARLPARAVMMSCIATVGRCGITASESFTNQQINSVICGPKVLPEFLYYAFTLLGHELESVGGGGSVYTNVSKSRFSDIVVTLPPLPEQKRIAHILGTLDDKIELNRRMNATLEGMSRAIFKSWFVDFDPVRQKAAGKQPEGVDARTAALFPDSFEDSEIGEVPTGWGVRPIGECFSIVDGATFRAEDRMPNSQIVAYGANGPVGFCSRANVHGPCIVLGKIGSCGSLHRSWSPCWVTNNAFAVSAGPAKSLEYTWQTIKGIDFAQYIGGSANPYMPLKNFRHHATLMPPEFLRDAYQRKVANQATLVAHHYQEAATLAALRDTLLPKLLSGEVRVPEAEGMVEEAVR